MDFNTIFLLIFGLIVLIIGGNLLLKSAVSISMKFGIPRLLIGMTVVSLATSAPELIVSIKSAIKGSPDLAISNVLGSNIANLGLVLGITILFSPINISKSVYKKEWPIMMFSALYFLIVILDGVITKIEGGILVCFLILPLIFFPKKLVLGRKEGLIILLFYSFYLYNLFY
jgi:cation:H+ antiporter